jgi:hypothetical protein
MVSANMLSLQPLLAIISFAGDQQNRASASPSTTTHAVKTGEINPL